MSPGHNAVEAAAIWSGKPAQKPLPWSPYEAALTAADGTPDEPLPTTEPEME